MTLVMHLCSACNRRTINVMVMVLRLFDRRQKGAGYHLDLLMIAAQIAICSLLGTPWFVAATVLSINHVRSLTRESESAAPGERPKFLGIRLAVDSAFENLRSRYLAAVAVVSLAVSTCQTTATLQIFIYFYLFCLFSNKSKGCRGH